MPRFSTISFFLLAAAAAPVLAPAQRLVAWGDNGVGQLNIPSAALYGSRLFTAGYYFTVAQKSDGNFVACGDNSYGELNVPAAAQSGVVDLKGGVLHTVAFKTDGSVVAWGSNERGETNVPLSASSGVTAVSAGEYYSLALKDGGVIGWGNNDYGVLNIPASVQSGVTAIASGSYHSLALKDGGVIAWGLNVAGSTDVPASARAGVKAIAPGYLHTLALKEDGSVVAWGWNSMGQCNVPAAAQSGVVAIAAGYDFSWALKADGTLIGWGDNDYGWLNIPAEAQAGVVGVTVGGYHTVAQIAAAYCTLDQTEVFAGDSATGTVKIAQAAPAGGTVVQLMSDDDSVEVPESVTVPQGQTTATFPVFTHPFLGASRNTTVRTSYGETKTVPFALKVKGTPVTAAFNVASVVGGSTTRPVLTVDIPTAQAGDTVLSLAYTPSLSGPATVTIPAGQTEAKVSVTANRVTTTTSGPLATLSSAGTQVGSATLEVVPIRATVNFDASSVQSGESALGNVYLNAAMREPLTVSLSSDNPAAPAPVSVTVKASGRFAVFEVDTTAVPANQNAKITATILGNSSYGNLKLLATPGVKSLTLSPTTYGNGRLTGTVRLTQAAKAGGTVVQLSSSDPSVTVPASVTVPEGTYAATFSATSADVSSETATVVTATNALGSVSTGVTVKPLYLASFTLTPTTVAAGGSMAVKVALNTPVAVDTVVALSCDDPGLVAFPATVTIPAGSRVVTVTATAGTPAKAKLVRVTATKNASALVRTFKVTP